MGLYVVYISCHHCLFIKLSKPNKQTNNIGKPSPVGGFPGASEPTGGGNSTDVDGGLGAGPIAGIAIAGVAVLALAAFLLLGRRGNQDEEETSTADNDIEQMSTQNNTKERLAITANGELDPDAPDGPQSPDATNSMTASDVSSIPSMSTKGKKGGSATTGAASSYYAKNSLLGGRPDEESMLSSSDGPSFFSTDDDTDEFGFETSLAGSKFHEYILCTETPHVLLDMHMLYDVC